MYKIILLLYVLLFILTTLLFLIFSKSKRPFKLGIIFGLIHFCLVSIMAVNIHFSKNGEAVMGWLYFYIADLPISIIIGKLAILTGDSILFPAFVILGSLQYFLLGLLIGWTYRRLTRPKVKRLFVNDKGAES